MSRQLTFMFIFYSVDLWRSSLDLDLKIIERGGYVHNSFSKLVSTSFNILDLIS